uniref:Major sperm protein n=1 Tax=Panagrolaimus sp. PS1159 TaxID=55785 RepID=A0AC35F295_9BILA
MGGENKKNEPEFQMKLEPDDKVVFKGKLNETVSVKITNTTKTRQCFKVKTSSNDMFRLRPPLGFVAPNESVTISIIFLAKDIPPKGHYVVFYHIPCKDDDKKPRSVWTPSATPEGVRRVVADFAKEDTPAAAAADKKDAPAPAESKDAPPKDAKDAPAKDKEPKDAEKDAPAKDAKDAPAKDAEKDAPAKDAEGKDAKDAPAKEADEQEKEKEKEKE